MVRHSFCSSVAWVGSRAAEHQHVCERRAGDACAALPRGYHRREPEKTVLYQAVQAHLATFLAELQEVDERGLPQYMELEFTRCLACGILREGFTRVRCDGCGNDFLAAFSCKSRGICHRPRRGARMRWLRTSSTMCCRAFTYVSGYSLFPGAFAGTWGTIRT